MTQMTAQAIQVRAKILEEMVEKYGLDTVKSWASDPAKASVINAMAQITADDEAPS